MICSSNEDCIVICFVLTIQEIPTFGRIVQAKSNHSLKSFSDIRIAKVTVTLFATCLPTAMIFVGEMAKPICFCRGFSILTTKDLGSADVERTVC